VRAALGKLQRRPAWRRRVFRRVRWGNLRRLEPFSRRYGYERGNPLDRFYIDRFCAAHSAVIRGRVLEVHDSRYVGRFGAGVEKIDIVDIDAGNQDASIVADLSVVGSLPEGVFDCAVITQTLMLVPDPQAAITNLWASLAPGGTLLVTASCLAPIEVDVPELDRWRVTTRGLEDLLARGCPGGEFEVEGHGNGVVALAFLKGLAQEDLRRSELEAHDPLYPIVVTGVARKPSAD
jgi:SAM-dependent methyltransferase